jgi:hypothetical protein
MYLLIGILLHLAMLLRVESLHVYVLSEFVHGIMGIQAMFRHTPQSQI